MKRWLAPEGRATEAAALAVIALVAFGVAVLADGGRLNPPNYLDPWIYTASMWNSDFMYHFYGATYYPSRVPWILPGYLLNLVFSHEAAFYIQHTAFALAGALAAWYLIRSFYGRTAALVVFALVSTSLLFYVSHSTDYPDGAQITFVLLGAAAGLTAAQARRRALRLGMAGFFLAAALGTNLFTGVYVLGVVLCYLLVRFPRPGRRTLLEVVIDAVPAIGGAALLLVACGSFAKSKGAEFLFFMPQWRALQAIDTTDYKLPASTWAGHEPRILIPCALIILVGVLGWPRRRNWADPTTRFAFGSWLFLTGLTVPIYLWEFVGAGNIVQTYYYFTVFTSVFALNLGTAVHLALGRWGPSEQRIGLVAGAAVAGAAPTVLIYAAGGDGLVGTTGMWISAALFGVTVLGAIVLVRRPTRHRLLVSTALIVTLAFTVNFASAASLTTKAGFTANRDAGGYFAIAGRLLDFMRSNHLQDTPPAFWSRIEPIQTQAGLQSLYLWEYTATNFNMPVVDSTFRSRIAALNPRVIVLICARADCNGGPAALTRAGYDIHERAHTLLASGRFRFWIRAFDIRPPQASYYSGRASAPVVLRPGRPYLTWTFQAGIPRDWRSAAKATFVPSVEGLLVTPGPKPWDYTLASPTLDLQPGRYRVVLSGRVLKGGLDLGILDLGTNQWLAQGYYWYGQRVRTGYGMQATAVIKKRSRVEIVLSNWMPTTGPLAWQVERIHLYGPEG